MSVDDFDLAQCGVPTDQPLYVEFRAYSPGNAFNTYLTEGSQTCQLQINRLYPKYYFCAVVVRDGILDHFSIDKLAQNYQLLVSPVVDFSTDNSTNVSVYTTTLPSGDVVTVERRATYEGIYTVKLLVFVALLAILGIVIVAVRFRG